MENYGYVRVSSCEQNEDRQLIAMHDAGIKDDHIYMDKQSGKDFERDGYKALVRCLRPGDCLYVKSIDRMGRNYEEFQNEWRRLVKVRKADIIVLDMPLLDTRTAKDLLGTFLSDILPSLRRPAESACLTQNGTKKQRRPVSHARLALHIISLY